MDKDKTLLIDNDMFKIEYHEIKRALQLLDKKARTTSVFLHDLKPDLIHYTFQLNNLILYYSNGMIKIYHHKLHRFVGIKECNSKRLNFVNNDYIASIKNQIPEIWILHKSDYEPLIYKKSEVPFECLDYKTFVIFFSNDKKKVIKTRKSTFNFEPLSCTQIYSIVQEEIKNIEIVLPQEIYKIDEFEFQAKSKQGQFLITYNSCDSYYILWKWKEKSYVYIEKNEKHTASLKRILFLDSEIFFVSLDSNSKMKIWNIYNDIPVVCQTITPDGLFNKNYYEDIEYDPESKYLKLISHSFIDNYHIDITRYKKKHENFLVSYIERELIEPLQKKEREHIDTNGHRDQSSLKHTETWKAKLSTVDTIESCIVEETNPIKLDEQTYSQTDANVQILKRFDYKLPQKVIENYNSIKATDKTSKFSRTKSVINVGVDFGTSRTKLSYGLSLSGERDTYRNIRDEEFIKTNNPSEFGYEDFVIPSIAKLIGDGIIYGFNALKIKNGLIFERLKQSVLQNEEKSDRLIITAGYLAYIFTLAKKQVLKNENIDSNVQFIYSVCLPVEQWDNNTVERFSYLLRFVEKLVSEDNEDIWSDINNLRVYYEKYYPPCLIEEREFTAIVPESVAEIIDFVNKTPPDDIQHYALYDFGAGTTDLTIFRIGEVKKLNKNNQDQPIKQGDVFKVEGDFTTTKKCEILETKIVYKGFGKIDSLMLDDEEKEKEIEKLYTSIGDEFEKSEVWEKAKKKVIGIESMRCWTELLIFVSGGASHNKVVQRIFEKSRFFRSADQKYVNELKQLEEPNDWEIDKPPFYRYAASWGLTKDPILTKDLYELPNEVHIIDVSPKMPPKGEPDPGHYSTGGFKG